MFQKRWLGLQQRFEGPQVITGSHDTMIKFWDLIYMEGRTMETLTHHKKSVRAMALHPTESEYPITKWRVSVCSIVVVTSDFMGDSQACSLLCPLIQVAQLRQRFFHSIAPGELAGDRRGVVPSLGFSLSAQQIWKVIKENRDLDLPAHKVMVATVWCEEIASDKLRRLSSNERWLALEDAVQSGPVPGFGNKLSSILDTYLFEYDMEAFYFDELVRKAKRQQLKSKALQDDYGSVLKWVDEVIPDAPYAITEEFMKKLFDEYNIDYIIHGDDPCLLPDGTDAYALAKKAGRYKQIKCTEGVSSTDIVGRMLLCVRERPSSESQNHSSLQRQFSHGHSQKSEDGGSGSGTRISHFLPTSHRIVQFSNGKVPISYTFLALFRRTVSSIKVPFSPKFCVRTLWMESFCMKSFFFSIAVVNKDPKKSKYSDTLHRFWKKEHDWGWIRWKKFMELSKVLDGFIDAHTLIIKARVQVIRFIMSLIIPWREQIVHSAALIVNIGENSLEGRTKSKNGRGKSKDAEDSLVPIVRIEEDMFILVDDVLLLDLLVEKAALEPLPPKDEAFHQLVARVDLNESEDQMVARYISGLSITIQDALAMQTLWTVSEAYNRALVAEKQEKRKFSRSGQQYQGGTKSGQPFYSYARGGSSSSGGQGASSGVGTQNRADKASTPAQNQPQSGASGLKSIPKWGL
ncbi:hypothetical protein RHGRI_010751 [Rhododendron griersonianum]|uniref:Uncharacterized protein n=1 Tax=Rhododendron griersonianum TaxID=479676 RepID=A0AAV6KJP6_9ERIC|nr:hypothetical protein RHGRI_010751 [Rhododendron griersonianum]